MSKDNDGDNKRQKPAQTKPPVKVLVTTFAVVVIAVLIAWLAYKWLIFNSQFLIANSDPTQYVTGGMLNVFVILAVVFQVLVYMRMAGQNERLINVGG